MHACLVAMTPYVYCLLPPREPPIFRVNSHRHVTRACMGLSMGLARWSPPPSQPCAAMTHSLEPPWAYQRAPCATAYGAMRHNIRIIHMRAIHPRVGASDPEISRDECVQSAPCCACREDSTRLSTPGKQASNRSALATTPRRLSEPAQDAILIAFLRPIGTRRRCQLEQRCDAGRLHDSCRGQRQHRCTRLSERGSPAEDSLRSFPARLALCGVSRLPRMQLDACEHLQLRATGRHSSADSHANAGCHGAGPGTAACMQPHGLRTAFTVSSRVIQLGSAARVGRPGADRRVHKFCARAAATAGQPCSTRAAM
eukprot:357765-Chlamydomonas_euryale.AAC.2